MTARELLLAIRVSDPDARWVLAQKVCLSRAASDRSTRAVSAVRSEGAVLLELAGGALPLILDGQPAIFSERNQQLFELSESAAVLIARLVKPQPFEQFHRELVDCLGGRVDEAYRQIVDWSDKGIVDTRINRHHPIFDQSSVAYLPIDHTCMEIMFGNDPTGQSLSAAFRHLNGKGSADFADIRVAVLAAGRLAVIHVEGRPSPIVWKEEAGPTLRSSIVEALLDSSRSVALHAACLEANNQAFVLLGESGAGKSTLTGSMRGTRMEAAGDDIVMLDPANCTVKGVPLPLTLKEDSWELFADEWQGFFEYPAMRRRDGQLLRYLPLPTAPTAGWMPVRAFIELRREDGVRPSLDRMSTTDCLRKLCSEAYVKSGKCTPEILQAMVASVDHAEALRLRYSEASDVPRLLEHHFAL